MLRWSAVLVLILLSGGQAIAEECMDCVERQSTRTRPDGTTYTFYEALCCDAPCAGGNWEMTDEDVGWGCLVGTVDWADSEGTYCASSERDLGCPDDTEPLPTVRPKPIYDDPGRNPDTSPESPIIFDTASHGYSLTSAAGGVRFEIRGDGHPLQTAWTRLGSENAFLSLDRNGNGRIDNGTELFGNHTPLRSGTIAPNGFVALAELDGNSDGVVDAADAAWTALLLWTDRNHDGVSSPDELQPIADSIIAGVETRYQRVGRKDQFGNEFRYGSHVRLVRGDETRQPYYDVFFRVAP